MSGPNPLPESTLRRAIETVLLVVVISLAVGLQHAHCEGTSVAKPVLIYGGLSVADLGSTYYAESHGAVEGNPFMQDHRAAKSLAIAGAFTAADISLQKHGKKGHARALRIVYAAWRIAAVAVNVRNARRK